MFKRRCASSPLARLCVHTSKFGWGELSQHHQLHLLGLGGLKNNWQSLFFASWSEERSYIFFNRRFPTLSATASSFCNMPVDVGRRRLRGSSVRFKPYLDRSPLNSLVVTPLLTMLEKYMISNELILSSTHFTSTVVRKCNHWRNAKRKVPRHSPLDDRVFCYCGVTAVIAI